MHLRLATRASALALYQANAVADALTAMSPDLTVELVTMETSGDRRTEVTIAQLGGQGVFIKEVQHLVLSGAADLAVHSAKDLPSLTTQGLTIAAFTERGDVRDALVGRSLAGLGPGATVACGAPRRRAVLAQLRPDLHLVELRGNIATRVARADERGVDAVVVAVVALERLGLMGKVAEILDPLVMVPQVGQGAFAVECREDDSETLALLRHLDHGPTRAALTAERSYLSTLGGGCSVPVGAWARPEGDALRLDALLASPDGSTVLRTSRVGLEASDLGAAVARELRDGAGGAALMQRWGTRPPSSE